MSGRPAEGPSLSEPSLLSTEYSDERRLAARRRVWNEFLDGPSSDDATLHAVIEQRPSRVMEVGAGWGELAARIGESTSATVIACDLSARMVRLARQRAVAAFVADAAELPIPDRWADVVVANAMLYHLADIDAGLAELARVLPDEGCLVATTFSDDHLREIWDLLGAPPVVLPFSAENADATLHRRFERVEVRTGGGIVTFPNSSELKAYVSSTILRSDHANRVPSFDEPFVARSAFAVFIARRPRRDEPP
jgi:ubiquinone/menaquinone biosynthesis C-methylase UbiE